MADKKHAVIRLDRMSGTIDGSKIKSAKFYKGSEVAEIDNGNVVSITNELVDREVFKVKAPTATDTRENVGIVASVEIIYDTAVYHYDLSEFVNKANSVIRVYQPEAGDIFSVTAEALTGVPAKGKYVKIAEGATTLAVSDSAEGAFGAIIDVETADKKKFYVISVK